MTNLELLAHYIDCDTYGFDRIAVITGAGISTDSGIPDFRSKRGLYNTFCSALRFNSTVFKWLPWAFYHKIGPLYTKIKSAKPNTAHKALAALAKIPGKRLDIITQNVDGLHQAAGSKHVYEIHGTLKTLTCQRCGKRVRMSKDIAATAESGGVPKHSCGGVLKPDIVFFGDACPEKAYNDALTAVEKADMIIICGTSLRVGTVPALLESRKPDAFVVVMNNEETALDDIASMRIKGNLSKMLGWLSRKVEETAQ